MLVLDVRRYSKQDELGEIESVYIGGGTPSFIGTKRLSSLLYAISVSTDLTREGLEFTMEANPDSLDERMVRDIWALGVNRLSIGVQSFDDEVLRILGRAHDADRAREAIRIAQDRFENVSIDLMCGIPGQSAESFKSSVEEAVQLGVKHVSVYPLTIEPFTYFDKLVMAGEMEERAAEHKEVPDGVHISDLIAESVEDGSDGIDHAACHQHEELIVRECGGDVPVGENDAPAGNEIAKHRRNGKFFQVNDVHGDSEHRSESHDGKNDPTCEVVHYHERVGGVGAGDQQEDGTVIHYLKFLFCRCQHPPVIKRGIGVKDDHGHEKHRHRNRGDRISRGDQQLHTHEPADNAEQCAERMRDTVQHFLDKGVGRQAQRLDSALSAGFVLCIHHSVVIY